VHRLLGAIPDSNLFRHGPDNPLAADLVVVDEASMMALPLVWALIRALPSECRLVLVGDRHQLASVEPGAVLGDLCDQRALQQFSPPAAGDLNRQASLDVPVPARTERLHPLCDSIVELRKVHRFSGDLARLNDAVRSGETATAISILRTAGQVEWIEEPVQEQLPARVHALLENELSGYLNSDTPQQALEAWSSFRILCAVRNGPAGVIAMNRALESLLLRRKRPRTSGDWFERQPVIVMRNNYRRRLYNGDIGVVMRDTEAPGAPLRAFFPATDGTLRPVSPHRLPEHESAFALTVHKSQGSEFDHVLLILPDQDSPVLSRELLYTAITRARKRLTIWATPSIMETALRRETIRETGLRDRLWRKRP
jgi:exodeoxyribonuclease V alpha subunit